MRKGLEQQLDLINKKSEEVGKMMADLNRRCVSMITSLLDETLNKKIVFLNDYESDLSVVYDGGRHPEYNSNAFSTFYGAYLDKNGNVMLETEDSDEYPLLNCIDAQGGNVAENIMGEILNYIDWLNEENDHDFDEEFIQLRKEEREKMGKLF